MDFKDLSYVLAIARYQNITKAANSLYVTQPTLTKFLQNLEAELGQKLFRKLGQYGVSIYETEFKALADAGDILPVDSGKGEDLWVLANTSLYDERTGLSLNPEYGKGDFV